MSKKDFIIIANIIRKSENKKELAELFANSLSMEYPNFNKSTFIKYILND